MSSTCWSCCCRFPEGTLLWLWALCCCANNRWREEGEKAVSVSASQSCKLQVTAADAHTYSVASPWDSWPQATAESGLLFNISLYFIRDIFPVTLPPPPLQTWLGVLTEHLSFEVMVCPHRQTISSLRATAPALFAATLPIHGRHPVNVYD